MDKSAAAEAARRRNRAIQGHGIYFHLISSILPLSDWIRRSLSSLSCSMPITDHNGRRTRRRRTTPRPPPPPPPRRPPSSSLSPSPFPIPPNSVFHFGITKGFQGPFQFPQIGGSCHPPFLPPITADGLTDSHFLLLISNEASRACQANHPPRARPPPKPKPPNHHHHRRRRRHLILEFHAPTRSFICSTGWSDFPSFSPPLSDSRPKLCCL